MRCDDDPKTAATAVTFPTTGTLLSTGASGTLGSGVGFSATDYGGGTIASGTYTPATTNGNFQTLTNGGAFTLAPPATSCTICVTITNNASAGAITTSGFTKVKGDSFDTTNGHAFRCYCDYTGGKSVLNVIALQ